MGLKAAVTQTVGRHGLIPLYASVLVAVSGGADSVALLHCLADLGYSIECAHLNHQFRGAEADDDAEFVRQHCELLSIPYTVDSINVPEIKEQLHISSQQAARKIRYEFLERVRADRKLDLIATAHNSDDRVETVLLNLVRGTGIDGLRAIPYRRGNVIRPLLDTSRLLVENYVKENGLTFRTDSSNSSAKYSRNNVRSELLPYLERRFNPSVRASLLRLADLAADESDFLSGLAEKWIGDRTTISVQDLLAEPTALQRRIIREWIRRMSVSDLADVSHTLVEQLRTRLAQPCAVTLPGGSAVLESDGKILIFRTLTKYDFYTITEIPIAANCDVVFGDYNVFVACVGNGVDEQSLHVRQWRDGDRITLTGGTRKVQDVFTDRKIPRSSRHFYPLLADRDGLVSVGDLRYAARATGLKVILAKAG